MNTYLHRSSSFGQAQRRFRVIKNSETITTGDWLTDEATGMADVDATSEKIAGFCTRIVTADKRPLESSSVVSGTDYTGTWTASTKTYAASATNADSGGDGVMVEYVPVREGDQFIATLSAAKGTTTGSDKEGYYLAILTSDASKLDETSAATTQASKQFKIADGYSQGTTTQVVVEAILRQAVQSAQA